MIETRAGFLKLHSPPYCVEPIDEIFEAIERIDKESSATQIVNTHNKEGKQ